MPSLPDEQVERALAIVAHPDDTEFWAGGTIAQWAQSGIKVTYCVLTDGEGGGFDPAIPQRDIPASRESHEDLVRIIRQARPQRILTWSPEWNWPQFRSCHPDHLATGAAALTAIYPDAGNPFAPPHLTGDGLHAWTVREAWLLNSPAREINHYVDITDTFDRKVAAVRAHRSQVKDPDTLPERLRERISGNAAVAGLPEDRLAEAFQVVATG